MPSNPIRHVCRSGALIGALCAALAAPAAPAQEPPGPPRIDLARALLISPQQAAEVEAVLKEEREQAKAARDRSRARLAQVLTPEQLWRLEQILARRRMGRLHSPPPRPPERSWDR